MRFLGPTVGVAGLLVMSAWKGLPQPAGGPQANPVIRVTVDLVQVDAVVSDSTGRHVPDLTPADFAVFEDGRRQKITHFAYVPAEPARSRPAVSPETRGESSMPPLSPAGPLAGQVHRTIVMIADDLGLAADDVPNVRKAMKNFVDRELRDSDLVSVMTASGGMGVMAQLTNDRRRLYASIDRIHWSPGRTMLTWYDPVHQVLDKGSGVENAANGRINEGRRPLLGSGTLGALAYAIQGLSVMPGRKAIALFSDGFPRSAAGIVEQANRAAVVIYTLDPRGLVSFALSAADYCQGCNVRVQERRREASFRASQRSLDDLARGTGGIFFHDRNDLSQGLVNALDDLEGYYLLAYQPRRGDFDEARGTPKFHRIDVKVTRPGLEVRSRSGFVGKPDPPPPTGPALLSAREELRRALFSPFQANGFPVHLSAFYSGAPQKDPRTGRRPAVLRAMLAIDARGLRFDDTAQGRKLLNLEVVAGAYGGNGEAVTSSDRTFRAEMTAEERDQTLASGLVYGLDVELPKPGPYQFRVAVRDANSGRVGSGTAFLEIPDFNQPGVALSSVLLSDNDPGRNALLAREGVLGAGSAVTRIFAPGATLSYRCTVFGARLDRETAKPDVDLEVVLFRGPERIFTGRPIPLVAPGDAPMDAIPAAGIIRLPPGLPPGDYSVELIAQDHLQAPKLQRAEEWVDFTLRK